MEFDFLSPVDNEIIQYIKQSTLPKICFPNGVILAKNLFLEKDSYENRKKQVEIRNYWGQFYRCKCSYSGN